MATLEDFLRAYDGGLGVVREYEGEWFLVLENGRACQLPGQEEADFLLEFCGKLKYGVVKYVDVDWRLTKPPVLTELQVKAVERVMGDEMLASLLKQAENGT